MNDDFSLDAVFDDDRLESLLQDAESIFELFFDNFVDTEGVDEDSEEGELMKSELQNLVEEAVGYSMVLLASLNAEVLTTTTDSSGRRVYEVRLTMPEDELEQTIQYIVDEFRNADD